MKAGVVGASGDAGTEPELASSHRLDCEGFQSER